MPEAEYQNRWNDPDFKTVLSFFEEISKIPRCSKNEEQIVSYLENFGKIRGFETKRDHCNNIVIKVPATLGMENLPAVILQSHTDMVCEKEAGTVHNFAADPLKLHYFDEDGVPFLTAEKTTLGADNGIGIAYSLAVAESKDIPHPPLELLFTTDEEIGLTGAQGMDSDFVSGSRMINLDSEEEGVIIVGCAGGTQIRFKRLVDVEDADAAEETAESGAAEIPTVTTATSTVTAANSDAVTAQTVSAAAQTTVPAAAQAAIMPYTVTVSGLLGGHSGTDIHIGRGNANQIAISFFKHLHEKYPQNLIKLIKIKGGTASNTIPRRAEISFAANVSEELIRAEAVEYADHLKNGPGFNDPGLRIEVAELKIPGKSDAETGSVVLKSFSAKNTGRILDFLTAVPNGVFEMSASIPDLVLVSGNLAVIRTKSSSEYFKGNEKEAEASDLDIYTEKSKRELEITLSLRSGNEIKLKEKIKEMMALAEKYHFNFEISGTYSPWEPDFNSDFVKQCADIYSKTFGKEVQVTAIHAGLECGVFHRTFPEMKMISIGPDITGAHTPDEKLNLAAAEKVWIYLKEILKSFENANG